MDFISIINADPGKVLKFDILFLSLVTCIDRFEGNYYSLLFRKLIYNRIQYQ